MTTINKTTKFIVGASGGEVSAITAEGEIVWTLPLSGGLYPAKTYLDLLQDGQTLDVSSTVHCVTAPDRLRPQKMDNATESGANPDFVVTSATRFQRELELKLAKLDQTAAKYERRMASLDDLARRAPKAAQEEPLDLVDDADPIFEQEEATDPSTAATADKGE